MVTRATAAVTYIWRADDSQVAHAHEYVRHGSLNPRGKRTLCGRQITDIRVAWPALEKCVECLALAGGRVVPSSPR